MRFLTDVRDTNAAAELVDLLLQASCFATFVVQQDDPATGRMDGSAYVYVSDDADMERAAAVLKAFLADGQVSRGGRCDGCGYDLTGHVGEGRCPECGWRFRKRASTEHDDQDDPDAVRPCPSCGEEAPIDFECCWNCGADITPEL